MAKKKRQADNLPDAEGYINSGIYSRFVGDKESHPEHFEQNDRFGTRSILESPDELISRMERRLEEVLNERKSQIPKSEWRGDECINEAMSAFLMLTWITKASQDHIPGQLIHMLVQLGELYERAQVRLVEPLALSGRARVEHAEQMREARAEALKVQHREHSEAAQQAMAWAKDKYPTAAYDNKITFLKAKAADKLGVSVDTLDRWLKK